MGIKYAQVYATMVEQGRAWKPLSPTSLTLGAPDRIDVAFAVMKPPLVWDAAQPKVHTLAHPAWQAGHGFEVLGAQGEELTILHADIDPDKSVVSLTLAAKVKLPVTVQYALSQDVQGGNQGGLPGGRIGHLRDSDNYRGYDAESLSCTAQAGSTRLICATGLARRAMYDLVEPGMAQVVQFLSATEVELSEPWSGANGTQMVLFRANQYNHCVSFSMQLTA